jgi:hypothetical protein
MFQPCQVRLRGPANICQAKRCRSVSTGPLRIAQRRCPYERSKTGLGIRSVAARAGTAHHGNANRGLVLPSLAQLACNLVDLVRYPVDGRDDGQALQTVSQALQMSIQEKGRPTADAQGLEKAIAEIKATIGQRQ